MEGRPDAEGLDRLTPREREVWEFLRVGLTNQEIAERLGVTLDGAKYHVSEIISKLGVRDRYEAASWPERRRWWTAVLAPIGLFWRTAAAASPVQLSSVAMVTSAGLAAAALAGIGLIVVLLVRSDGEQPMLASGVEQEDVTFDGPLLVSNRTHLSLCVGGEDGSDVSDTDLDAVRTALEEGLAAQPEIPPEYSQREVTAGCPPPSEPLGTPERERTIGLQSPHFSSGDGDTPSEHLVFVYLISTELYETTFENESYAFVPAEFGCSGDQCWPVTTGLYLPSSATSAVMREGLLDSLRLLPREPNPEPTLDWEACERGTPPHPDNTCDQYDEIID